MDSIYLLKNSPHANFEIRFSRRSLADDAPYIHKVWVFGDKPAFLSDGTAVIQEDSRCGIYTSSPPYEEIVRLAEGKWFFSFDDPAFGEPIRRFLEERFPEKSKYEK